MPEIVHLSAGAFIGEKLKHVKRDGHRHFLHGFGLVAVLDVRLDELRCRHGSYAFVTPGQKIITGRFCCQHLYNVRRRSRTRRAAAGTPAATRRGTAWRAPLSAKVDIYMSIR